MIIVIQAGKVWATHSSSQKTEITSALYPEADKIIELVEGVACQPGDDDPTIANPGDLAGVLFAPVQVTYTTPDSIVMIDTGKLTTLYTQETMQ